MDDLVLRPIGYVCSPWERANGTPVQPFVALGEQGGWPGGPEDLLEKPFADRRGGRGTLVVEDAWMGALRDLDGFSHLWAIFWIDRSGPATPLVKPYRDTVERGLFATRSPMRPNPIGLSCLEIVSVSGRCVHVTGLDLLDGTPLLDIKPYIPDYDCFRDAARGWMSGSTARPEIVRADDRFCAP